MDQGSTSVFIHLLFVGLNRKDERAVRAALKAEGIRSRISTCQTIDEAIRRLERKPVIQLILVEDRLPDPTGVSLQQKINCHDERPPLLLLFEKGEEERAVEALDVGVDRILIKDSEQAYITLLPSLISRLILQDLDQRAQKQREVELKEAATRYRELFETSGDAIVLMKGDRLIECNSQALSMFGCTEDDIIGNTPYAFSPPKQRDGRSSKEKALEKIACALEEGPQRFEWVHQRLDGELFDAEIALTPLELKGEPYLLASVRDITDRNRIVNQLKTLSMAIEQYSGGLAILDREGVVEYANPKLGEPNHLRPEEMVGKNWRSFLSQQSSIREHYDNILNTVVERGEIWRGEISDRAVDAKTVWREVSILPIKNERGEVLHSLYISEDITERKKAEDRIKALAMAVEQSSNAIAILNEENILEYVNPSLCDVYGIRLEDVVGRHWRSIVSPDDALIEKYPEIYKAVEEKGEIWRGEITDRADDGELIWRETTIRPLKDDKGEIKFTVYVSEDVTERRLAEQELRDALEFERLVATISTRMLSIEQDEFDAEIIRVLEELGQFLHVQRCTLLQRPEWGEPILLTHEWYVSGEGSFKDLLSNVEVDFPWVAEKVFLGETLYIPNIADMPPEAEKEKKKLKEHSVHSFLQIPMLFENELIGSLGFAYDPNVARITEKVFPLLNTVSEIIASAIQRNRIEGSLYESEERFRLLADATFEGIGMSAQGRILDVNEQLAKILGYKPDEMIGMNVMDLVAPESRDLVSSYSASGHEAPYEHIAKRKDGSTFPVEVHAKSIPYKGKSVRVTAIQDISERKRNEDALRESEARKALLLRSMPMAFYSGPFGGGGGGVWFSEQVQNICGYSADYFIADEELWESRLHPEDRDRVLTAFEELNEQDTIDTEYRWKTADGRYLWILHQAVLIQSEDGESKEIIGTLMDITDRKRSEDELHSAFEIERLVATISSRLASIREDTFDTEIELSLRDLGRFLGAKRCNFFQRSLQNDHFELTHDWCDEGVDSLKDVVQRIEKRDLPWIMNRLEQGEIIHIPDVANLPENAAAEKAFALAHGTKSFLQFPMYFEGELIGTIGINYDRKGTDILEKPVPLLKTLGELFASAVARKRAEEAIRRSEATLQSIFRTAPVGIGLLTNRIFEWANDAFQQMTGYSENEILGKSTRFLYESGEEYERVGQEEYELLTKDGISTFETHLKRKDGHVIDVMLSLSPIVPDDHSAGIIFVALDISERKRYEESIQEAADRLKILHEIDRSILEAESAADIAHNALQRVCELIPSDRASLVLFDINDEISINVLASVSSYDLYTSGQTFKVPNATFRQAMGPLQRGLPIIIDDTKKLEQPTSLQSEMAKAGIRSILNSPMILQGELIGTFNLGAIDPGYFTQEHIEIAKEVADSLATSIHQARLLEMEQRRRQELEIFAGVSIALRSADNQEGLLSILLEEAMVLFHADASAIWIPQTCELEQVITQDLMKPEELFPEKQILNREIQSILNVDKPVFLTEMPFQMEGVTSMVVAPLRAENIPDRTLALYYAKRKDFKEDERRMLKTITDVVVIALGRIAILESLEKQVNDRTREITTLYELAEISASSEDLPTILAQSLHRVLTAVDGQAGTLHLLSDDSTNLEMVVHRGLPSELEIELQVTSLEDPFWERIADKHEPLLLMDLRDEIHTPLALLHSHLRCFIGVPIIARDEVLGIISIFHTIEHDPSADEISLLGLVSDQIGLAVERTRLREQTRDASIVQERQRLARELHDAVTQSLYSLSFIAKASRNLAKVGQWDQVEKHLLTVQEMAQQSLKEMRLLVYELMPSSLEEQGLVDVLKQRLDFVEDRSGVETEIITEGTFDLPSQVQVGIYRIAQEALNNTLKHSAATRVVVRLYDRGNRVEMEIEDNGIGFNPEKIIGGMGLANMRERARNLGGELSIESSMGRGTRVRLLIDEVLT